MPQTYIPRKPRAYVGEGGGVRGFAHIGVLMALADLDLLKDIDDATGTSIGSLVVLMMCLGYSPREMRTQFMALNIPDYVPGQNWWAETYNFLKHNGLHSMDQLEKLVKSFITAKLGAGSENITLGAFADRVAAAHTVEQEKGVRDPLRRLRYPRFKSFDESRCYEVTFSATAENGKYKDMPLWKAVISSMAYEGYFIPQKYEGEQYGDGGAACNYDITGYDSQDGPNLEVVGVWTSDPAGCEALRHGTPPPATPIKGKLDMASRVVEGELVAQTLSVHKHPADLARTIIVNVGQVSALQLNITTLQKNMMMHSGWHATLGYYQPTILGQDKPALPNILSFDASHDDNRAALKAATATVTPPTPVRFVRLPSVSAAQAESGMSAEFRVGSEAGGLGNVATDEHPGVPAAWCTLL